MKKIPTVFRRDPDARTFVVPEVAPGCEWVLAGEGRPTRKYDGSAFCYADDKWWARREVKPGRPIPPEFLLVQEDAATGKRFGWEPLVRSGYSKYVQEALLNAPPLDTYPINEPVEGGTYELVGPKVNGNPEGIEKHLLVRHGYTAAEDREAMQSLPRDFDGIAAWLLAHEPWEGIVFWHDDGRRAKIKRRDFPVLDGQVIA